ncbi:MAG: thioredoxin domain-containing protein [Chloroflexia bacterium]|nr:thioredoxin domain-containing protein [Chloroflexia bacterium]
MPNRLATETSPYLLQHQHNPVDWYPWGAEALERARREDKPILVSIGYSACHWCHVMAHESFEDPGIAALMNDYFVNIKVDREERPDIDSIYMTAVQAMSRQGGWPLNVFLTSEAVPFFGGTYWPPVDRQGMPGFPKVLEATHHAWSTNRDNVRQTASQVLGYLSASAGGAPAGGELSGAIADGAVQRLWAQFDQEWGGFGRAPKFPQASVLEFMLRHCRRTGDERALEMLTVTLDRMAEGGIYDHLGGGFARYAVDGEWLVPHFEKMLYDNAQLMSVYLDAWRLTGREGYRRVVEETADWTLREMRSPDGGFYAALDADSEGVEGKFYVWTVQEVDDLLEPDEADLVKLHYGVTESGNFEGQSILHVDRPLAGLAESSGEPATALTERLDRARGKLLKTRAGRVRPGTDTKIIVSWNGLMIGALASAGVAFGRSDLVEAARAAATLVLEQGIREHGSLARTLTAGQASGDGMLEDHAFLADGLLALYAATGEHRWLEHANDLAKSIVDRFTHTDGPGFFDTGQDHEQLIIRPRELQDGAIPCGNSVAIDVLLTLVHLREDDRSSGYVNALLSSIATPMAEHPTAFGRFLAVLERTQADQRQLVLAGGPEVADLRTAFVARYEPFVTLAYAMGRDDGEGWPTLGNRPIPAGASAAAFLCQGMTCLPPVTSPPDLIAQLDAAPYTKSGQSTG